jgi:hypothetical protein
MTRPLDEWDKMPVSDLRAMCKQITSVRGIGRMKKAGLLALLDEATVRGESARALAQVLLQDIIHKAVTAAADDVAASELPSGATVGAFYEVEQVIGSRWVDGQEFLHIRWKGFGPTDDTWEPRSHYKLLDPDDMHTCTRDPPSTAR